MASRAAALLEAADAGRVGEAVEAFAEAHDADGAAAVPDEAWGETAKEAKHRVLRALLALLASLEGEGGEEAAPVLRALKVMTRTRTHLQPLFEEGNARAVVRVATPCAPDGMGPEAELAAVTLLSNMLVLDRANVLRLVAEEGAAPRLLDALERRGGDARFAFIASRALFVAALDRQVSEPLVGEHQARERVLAACRAAVGEGAARVRAIPADADTFAARRAAAECMKLLFALVAEHEWSEEEGAAAPETLEAAARLVRDVLGAGGGPRAGEDLDRRVARADAAERRRRREADEAAVEEVRARDGDAAAAEAAEAAGLDPLRNDEEEAGLCEAPDGLPDEADPPAVAEDAGMRPRDPLRLSLVEVMAAAGNLLLYLPKDSVAAAAAADPAAVHGLACVLDCAARRPAARRGEREGAMTPACMALGEVVGREEAARRYVKRYVFGALAEVPGGAPKPKVTMQPQGQATERRDPQPSWLKGRMLATLTSFSMHLKTAVEELLWKLCCEDSSDFIRLAGFGSAVGLLANKGMPGFAHLSQNAIDIDELVEAKRARDEAEEEKKKGQGQEQQ